MAANLQAKLPPHSPDSEVALLSAILGNGTLFQYVNGLLHRESFYKRVHGTIFYAMSRLHDRGEPIDSVTVSNEIESIDSIDKVDHPMLEALVTDGVSEEQAIAYAQIIVDTYDRRRILESARRMALLAYNDSVSGLDAYTQSQQLLSDAEPLGTPPKYIGGPDLVRETLKTLAVSENERRARASREYSATWPWRNLRGYVRFWRAGQPVFVISESGVGKTMFLMDIARYNAMNGGNVFYVHTEDEAIILLQRQLAAISGVPFSDIESAEYDEENYDNQMVNATVAGVDIRVPTRLLRAIQSIDSGWRGNLWFIDGAGKGISEIIFEITRLGRKHGNPDCVVFDWFGDHDLTQSEGTTEVMKLIHGIQSLKTFSAKSKLRLIVATQTGKAGAQKTRLAASDAFMTSAVAHYGKTVFTLNRKRVEGADGNQTAEFAPNMDVTIAKSNLDRVGTVRLGVNGATMTLYDLGDLIERGEL